jgi:hypothetical protein
MVYKSMIKMVRVSLMIIIFTLSIIPTSNGIMWIDAAYAADPDDDDILLFLPAILSGKRKSEPAITVTAVANPNNVLSVYANWTTETPMDSEVQFGAGGYQYRIYDNTEVTNHHVLVIGMHAETTYKIKAISSNNAHTLQGETTWRTGSLPIGVPEGVMLTNNTALSQSGWTLMNVQVGNGSFAFSDYPARVVMYDHDGLPVWYYIDGPDNDRGGALSTELLDSNTVLIGPTGVPPDDVPPREVDLAGNIIWEGPATVNADEQLSHDVRKLSNGNYLLLRWMKAEGEPTDARLEEVNSNNEVVWSWNLYDFYTPPESAKGDWCHANSATVDIENDEVYLSCRWLGLFKTAYNYDRSNPELQYHLPAVYHSSGEGDMTFYPPESQFNDIHDPEVHDNGTIIFFDNDGWDFVNSVGGYHSRVLEFSINEKTKVAELVWEFPGIFDVDSWFTDEFYCPYWGDANRLENGNVLIAAGVRGTGSISHVFEVTNGGEVVWDFTLPEDHGVYRATRISPPLIEPL